MYFCLIYTVAIAILKSIKSLIEHTQFAIILVYHQYIKMLIHKLLVAYFLECLAHIRPCFYHT